MEPAILLDAEGGVLRQPATQLPVGVVEDTGVVGQELIRLSGSDNAVSTAPLALAQASPSSSWARGSRHRAETSA